MEIHFFYFLHCALPDPLHMESVILPPTNCGLGGITAWNHQVMHDEIEALSRCLSPWIPSHKPVD